jgi:hypothetical protein
MRIEQWGWRWERFLFPNYTVFYTSTFRRFDHLCFRYFYSRHFLLSTLFRWTGIWVKSFPRIGNSKQNDTRKAFERNSDYGNSVRVTARVIFFFAETFLRAYVFHSTNTISNCLFAGESFFLLEIQFLSCNTVFYYVSLTLFWNID